LVGDNKGRLKSVVAEFYGDCGVAVQSQLAPWVRYTYDGLSRSLEDFDVNTNAPGAKPFRAPGGPAAFWALESSIDEIALMLKLDPVEARRKWDKSEIRRHLYDWVADIPEYRDRGPVNASSGRFKKGIGVAIGNWFNIYTKQTKIELSSTPDGLVARTAAQDMGNGLRSVIAKAIAREFGISPLEVDVQIGHSNYVEGPVSTGSRGTNSVYAPSMEAAVSLKNKLLKRAQDKLGLKDPRWDKGGISHEQGHVPAKEIFRQFSPITVVARRDDNGLTDVLGKFPSTELAMNLIPRMTGSVCMAEVVVDTLTGIVKVTKFWAGIGAGKIVNPELARSQVYGAVIQGTGYALYEERLNDPTTGVLLTAGLEEYRIPGIGDTPGIEVYF
jgi:xanthine dehydrogenase YagR molybdenum-binding subunit